MCLTEVVKVVTLIRTQTPLGIAATARGACLLQSRILPTAGRANDLIDLLRSPSAGLILVHWRIRFQDRVDDPPGFFHGILAGEQRRVAAHRVAQQPLVGIHFVRGGVAGRFRFDACALFFRRRA